MSDYGIFWFHRNSSVLLGFNKKVKIFHIYVFYRLLDEVTVLDAIESTPLERA